MKKIIVIFWFIFLIPIICFAKPPRIIEKYLSSNRSQRYILQLPSNYDVAKKYPLFIAIHWYTGNAMQQIEEWKFYTNKQGYVMLCPEFSSGYQWLKHGEDKRLIQIIKEVEEEFSIDRDNIFLVGNSGGAQFAHRFAFKHPEYVKAVCIIAAGEYDSPPPYAVAKKIKYFIGVGEEDDRYRATLNFYKLFKKEDYDAEFKSFPLIGHTLHSKIKDAVIDFLKKMK